MTTDGQFESQLFFLQEDDIRPFFEWSTGYEIKNNEKLTLEEDNEIIEVDTETN